MKKTLLLVFSLLMVVSMLLAACSPQTVEVVKTVEVEKEVVKTVEVEKEVTVEKTVEVEKVVEVTATPAPIERNGAWLDRIIVIEEPSSEAGVSRLESGDIDVYSYTISDPDLFATVKANPDLAYSEASGSSSELTFNVAGPVFETTGKLNPFAVKEIREAMNWLIDRNYIAQEIYGGLATPRWSSVSTAAPDYATYIDLFRAQEAMYQYNPDKAKEILTTQMEALGATMVDGKWNFNGEPVSLIFLIRTEDERREMGDYISNQLEDAGFTIDRQYKSSADAAPLWLSGDPADGAWNLYTGGWGSSGLSRDNGYTFAYFQTNIGRGNALWQAYQVSDEFYTAAEALWNNEFATMDERRSLFETALSLELIESNRLFMADRKSFTPYKASVAVASDLAGAISGSQLWGQTIRFKDQVGGELVYAMPSILTEPWNPIDGTNWVYDNALIRATGELATVSDPYTGLSLPNRIEKAEVTATEGLPINQTLDWVSLDFAPSIEVPADAWYDWDAENQRFITVGEAFTSTQTSQIKSVVYYPQDMWDTVKWHDGSSLSMGDFILGMILTWDRAKETSPLYDSSYVPRYDSFMSVFKGVKIISTDPLVIETYRDDYGLDAELSVTDWWPYYRQGQGSWHMLVPGILAETNSELAFSSTKATELEVEYMSYIGGPSLEILKKYLDQAAAENYIPYSTVMGEYVTAEEATARYANYEDFYQLNGHFWLGTNMWVLDKVFPVEGTVTLARFADHPDSVEKWNRFGAPPIGVVEVDGPGRVTAGEAADYNVYLTLFDEPYPAADLDTVKYLVFDATGALALSGEAELVADGEYAIALTADDTKALPEGSAKLEVVVVSKIVAVPAFESLEFVVAP